MTSPTHFSFFFLSLCCLHVNVSYYHGWSVSPWLPSGCQGFSFPRIDGLSRKRGSKGAEEERNYFGDSLSFCFIFYLWSCSLFFRKALTERFFAWSLNIRGGPSLLLLSPACLPVCLWILAFISYTFLSLPLFLSSVFTSLMPPPSPPLFDSPSSVRSGVAVTSLLLTIPLLSSPHFSRKMLSAGNTWEHLLTLLFCPSSRPIFLPFHPPILLSSFFTKIFPLSLHLPPFLTFTPSKFFPSEPLHLFPRRLRHINWLLINRVCLKQTAFIAITKAH